MIDSTFVGKSAISLKYSLDASKKYDFPLLSTNIFLVPELLL